MALVFSPRVQSDDEFIMFLKILSKIANSMNGEEWIRIFSPSDSQVINILIQRWHNDRADVRKAVVYALAHIGVKMGPRYVKQL